MAQPLGEALEILYAGFGDLEAISLDITPACETVCDVSGAWVQVLTACPAPVSLLVTPAPSAAAYVDLHAIPTPG